MAEAPVVAAVPVAVPVPVAMEGTAQCAACLAAPPAFDSGQPELMCRRAQDVDFSGLHFAALVAGPGLGDDVDTVELLQRTFESDSPLLLDADALNLMAAEPELQSALAVRTGVQPMRDSVGQALRSALKTLPAVDDTHPGLMLVRLHIVCHKILPAQSWPSRRPKPPSSNPLWWTSWPSAARHRTYARNSTLAIG